MKYHYYSHTFLVCRSISFIMCMLISIAALHPFPCSYNVKRVGTCRALSAHTLIVRATVCASLLTTALLLYCYNQLLDTHLSPQSTVYVGSGIASLTALTLVLWPVAWQRTLPLQHCSRA